MGMGLAHVQAIFCSAAFAGLLAGCGPGEEPHPETVPVQGKVTYQGQPVPKGTVTFQPASGQPAVGEIQPMAPTASAPSGRRTAPSSAPTRS